MAEKPSHSAMHPCVTPPADYVCPSMCTDKKLPNICDLCPTICLSCRDRGSWVVSTQHSCSLLRHITLFSYDLWACLTYEATDTGVNFNIPHLHRPIFLQFPQQFLRRHPPSLPSTHSTLCQTAPNSAYFCSLFLIFLSSILWCCASAVPANYP